MALSQEQILYELDVMRGDIEHLEAQLKPLRVARDSLVLRALAYGLHERETCAHAGITRGWLFTLKKINRRMRVRPEND